MTVEMKYDIGDLVWLLWGKSVVEERIRACYFERHIVSREQRTQDKKTYGLMAMGGIHDESDLYPTKEDLLNMLKTKTQT